LNDRLLREIEDGLCAGRSGGSRPAWSWRIVVVTTPAALHRTGR
jgi:hypothetical protein